MSRAVAAIVSTVIGLVLLLGFKSHTGHASTPLATIQRSASPSTSPTTKSTSKATAKKKTSTTTVTTRTFTGDTIDTQYGAVQVQITVRGSQLTDVSALQLPDRSGRDIELDNYAVPQLRQEALGAQSANINSVSGATFTSDGYIRSLQSALDRAGI
jgi:uncharacterized protein with FMN-binding domain